MKTLIVLRHGKTEEQARGGDRARTLTERGRRESATMGRLIGELAQPDLVVSSNAARARETAEIASAWFDYAGEIVIEPAIYAAMLDTLIAVVRDLPDDANVVVLVGHNPGFEDLSWALAEEGSEMVRLPTAAFAHLELEVPRWKDVREGRGRLVGVHSPKGEREG